MGHVISETKRTIVLRVIRTANKLRANVCSALSDDPMNPEYEVGCKVAHHANVAQGCVEEVDNMVYEHDPND